MVNTWGSDTMIIIAFVDDNFGTMFNNRRQSQDVKVIERILNSDKNAQWIYMSPYTAKLFKGIPNLTKVIVDDEMLDYASDYDLCIIEGQDLSEYTDKIKGVILYKWNRTYPHDKTFDLDLSGYTLMHSEEFVGHSHEKITEELYLNTSLSGDISDEEK